jgi:hypothetical protein
MIYSCLEESLFYLQIRANGVKRSWNRLNLIVEPVFIAHCFVVHKTISPSFLSMI